MGELEIWIHLNLFLHVLALFTKLLSKSTISPITNDFTGLSIVGSDSTFETVDAIGSTISTSSCLKAIPLNVILHSYVCFLFELAF